MTTSEFIDIALWAMFREGRPYSQMIQYVLDSEKVRLTEQEVRERLKRHGFTDDCS